jgi:hypothetical protein
MSDFSTNLQPDEKQLWSGRPKGGLLFGTADLFIAPFAMFFAGGMIFWLVLSIQQQWPIVSTILAAILSAFGLHLLLFRFLVDTSIREGTRYVLTDKRIYIQKKGKLQSFELTNFKKFTLDAAVDGTGTIIFGEKNAYMHYFGNNLNGWPGMPDVPTFQRIDNAQGVFKMIGELRKAS